MEENKKEFTGLWIPAELWEDTNLNWTEKLMLVEINSFNRNGTCFAGNEYLANFFNLSKDRVSKIISSLKNKGYIDVTLKYKEGSKLIDKRIITATFTYRRKQLGGIVTNDLGYSCKQLGGIGENNEDINKDYYNNIYNNLMSEIKISDVALDMQIYFNCAEAFRKLFIKIAQREGLPTKIYDKAKYKDYVTPIRLAVEADGYTIEQIRQAYNYLNSSFDDFWYKNIRSAKKLRQQLDKLVLEFNKVNKTA